MELNGIELGQFAVWKDFPGLFTLLTLFVISIYFQGHEVSVGLMPFALLQYWSSNWLGPKVMNNCNFCSPNFRIYLWVNRSDNTEFDRKSLAKKRNDERKMEEA